jgi:hypothetical protein
MVYAFGLSQPGNRRTANALAPNEAFKDGSVPWPLEASSARILNKRLKNLSGLAGRDFKNLSFP